MGTALGATPVVGEVSASISAETPALVSTSQTSSPSGDQPAVLGLAALVIVSLGVAWGWVVLEMVRWVLNPTLDSWRDQVARLDLM